MKKIGTYLTNDAHAQLQWHANKEGKPLYEVLERIIIEFLQIDYESNRVKKDKQDSTPEAR